MPETVEFLTKPEIALARVKAAQAAGTPDRIVLADAGYGNDTGFRDGLTEIGALYAVGVQGTTRACGHPASSPYPQSPGAEWRASLGCCAAMQNTDLSSHFAAVRVQAAHRDHWRTALRDEEWLLIEWPEGQSEPENYVPRGSSTRPAARSQFDLDATVDHRSDSGR